MVSKKELNQYEFIHLDNYFEYIIESQINGQKMQVSELIKKLSKNQKKLALNYFQFYIEPCKFSKIIESKIIGSF